MLATLRQRNFALLWFGGLVSMTGDWMLLIALPVYVYDATGSTLATGAMFAARLLPDALFGSVTGVFVDHWDRRRTLVVVNLLMALTMLPLLAVPSTGLLWIVYAMAFVEVSVGAFLVPAENALLPRLVGPERLMAANSLNALNNNLARLVGPPLGGVAVATLGLGGVALLNAVSFVVVAAMVWLITGDYEPEGRTADGPPTATPFVAVWRELVEGLVLLRGGRLLPTVFVAAAAMGLGEGVMAALFVPFVRDVLDGGAPELGWLMTAQAVGGLIGGLLVGSLARTLSPARLFGASAVLFGLIDLAIFNYPAFVPGIGLGLVLFVVVGVPAVMVGTGQATLLQTGVADAYRGRVFGALGTTSSLLLIAGSVLAGTLAERLGVVTVLNVQGLAYAGAGVLVLLALGGRGARRRTERAAQEAGSHAR